MSTGRHRSTRTKWWRSKARGGGHIFRCESGIVNCLPQTLNGRQTPRWFAFSKKASLTEPVTHPLLHNGGTGYRRALDAMRAYEAWAGMPSRKAKPRPTPKEAQIRFRIGPTEPCPDCDGSGFRQEGGREVFCSTCEGSGKVLKIKQQLLKILADCQRMQEAVAKVAVSVKPIGTPIEKPADAAVRRKYEFAYSVKITRRPL